MRKTITIFTLFLAFVLQLTTANAQTQKLTFKQLIDDAYYIGVKDAMTNPVHVRRLQLDMTGKTKFPEEIMKLPNLQMLYLSGSTRQLNWATAAPELLKMKNLEYIYFLDSGLKTIPTQVFTLTKLKGLAVLNSSVSVVPAEIAKLSGLEVLLLINNRISVLPVQLTTLKNLKVIVLDANRVSVFPPQIANLKKLEELSIAENPVKNEEVKKLKKYLPNTKIIEYYEMPVVEEPKQ